VVGLASLLWLAFPASGATAADAETLVKTARTACLTGDYAKGGKIKGYGELLTAFRAKDKDGSGFIDEREDKSVIKLDQDGDKKAALWEIMEAVNKKQGKEIFPIKARLSAQNGIPLMPNVSPANIAQFIFMIETEQITLPQIQAAFKHLDAVMARMKKEDFSALPPLAKLQRAKAIIKAEGFTLFTGDTPRTLVAELAAKRLHLVSINWLLMIVGRELKWPVSLAAYSSQYQYIKWEEKGDKFNYMCTLGPNGGSVPDSFFKDQTHMSEVSLRAGVYMKSLSELEFLGTVYANLAGVYRAGDCSDFACDKTVTQATDKALAYNPRSLDALFFRAQTLFAGNYPQALVLKYPGPDGKMITGPSRNREAIKYYDRAIKLDPNNSSAYFMRAQMIAHGLFDCKTASKDYDRAVALIGKLDPKTTSPEEREFNQSKAAETKKIIDMHKQDCEDRVQDERKYKPIGNWELVPPPPPGFFREMRKDNKKH